MERDFRAELEEKEAKHFKKKVGAGAAGGGDLMLGSGGGDADAGGPSFVPKAIDADDDSEEDDSDDDSDEDDDEDDTAALLAELERIKRERAEVRSSLPNVSCCPCTRMTTPAARSLAPLFWCF